MNSWISCSCWDKTNTVNIGRLTVTISEQCQYWISSKSDWHVKETDRQSTHPDERIKEINVVAAELVNARSASHDRTSQRRTSIYVWRVSLSPTIPRRAASVSEYSKTLCRSLPTKIAVVGHFRWVIVHCWLLMFVMINGNVLSSALCNFDILMKVTFHDYLVNLQYVFR